MDKIGYFNGSHPRNNVTSFLEDHVQKNPKQTVLLWAKQGQQTIVHDSVDAQGLLSLVSRTASGFKNLGIKAGDRVILFVPMSLPLYTAMFALQRIGAIPVFLDSWARRNQLGMSAQIVAAHAMISFEKAFVHCQDVPELNSIPLKICVGPATQTYSAQLEALMQSPTLEPAVAVEREATALITFTTGSSGVPKGADRTHRFLAAQHYALNECIPYNAHDVDLPVFPIFSLNNLAAGVPTVIPAFDIGTPGDRDPEILLAQIKNCQVTCTTLSPSLFHRFAQYCLGHNITLPELRRVVTGGAPVSVDQVKAMQQVTPNAEILVLFGSTEAEPMAHIEGRDMVQNQVRASQDPEWVDDGVNVGKMAAGLQYKFLKIRKTPITISSPQDWDQLVVAQGQVGELIVAGEHVCRQYYNDAEAFKRAKILDTDGTVWHRTGDLGRIDNEGNLWIVGRVHNAIERAGQYYFPVRAELVMKKVPHILKAAYLGVQDPKLGEKTVCVVSVDQESESPVVEKTIHRLMDKHAIPYDQIIFQKDIPMDPRHHSKVEYDVLRKQLMEGNLV